MVEVDTEGGEVDTEGVSAAGPVSPAAVGGGGPLLLLLLLMWLLQGLEAPHRWRRVWEADPWRLCRTSSWPLLSPCSL